MKRLVVAGLVICLALGIAIGQDLDDVKKKISDAAKNGNWTEFAAGIKELGSIDNIDSVKTIW